jgi:hypothetical protein
MTLTEPARQGESGGPITNGRGEVVGVTFGSDFKQTTWCTRVNTIGGLLDRMFPNRPGRFIARNDQLRGGRPLGPPPQPATPAMPYAQSPAAVPQPGAPYQYDPPPNAPLQPMPAPQQYAQTPPPPSDPTSPPNVPPLQSAPQQPGSVAPQPQPQQYAQSPPQPSQPGDGIGSIHRRQVAQVVCRGGHVTARPGWRNARPCRLLACAAREKKDFCKT